MRDDTVMRRRGDGWLGTVYVGEVLGVSQTTVRRMIDRGVLEGYRFGKVYRIRKSELQRYLGVAR
jgi:excisionase family DNA binding protein